MRSPEEYRKYANECERIAREGPEENRRVLLEIAGAWRQCAEDAERKAAQRYDREADAEDA
jgi:hypothetical protein